VGQITHEIICIYKINDIGVNALNLYFLNLLLYNVISATLIVVYLFKQNAIITKSTNCVYFFNGWV
jgi:hypothetical protein